VRTGRQVKRLTEPAPVVQALPERTQQSGDYMNPAEWAEAGYAGNPVDVYGFHHGTDYFRA